jgi:UDP-N-acetylglucosamine 4-epimerase
MREERNDVGTFYEAVIAQLRARPRRWLVTGAAGFIGSHLVEHLLKADQIVIGLDNLSTGRRENLAAACAQRSPPQSDRFEFIEGDIRDASVCRRACAGVDVVLHQAALGSVPRSIHDPMTSHDVNVTGFLQILAAARHAGIQRVVYASSSSVYGDHAGLPKVEEVVGRVLSPFAATKYANELYAHAFGRSYGLELVGLRYFNVFGPRQDPHGPYAAVIPLWFAGMLSASEVAINGDGETSRDFCYVENVVQANLLAATSTQSEVPGQVFNVACGQKTTLNELFGLIRDRIARTEPGAAQLEPVYRAHRAGDVRHSLADISKARALLRYEPTHTIQDGLDSAASWYVAHALARAA